MTYAAAESPMVLCARAQLRTMPIADQQRVRATVDAMKASVRAAGPLGYIALAVIGAEITATKGDADALGRVLAGEALV